MSFRSALARLSILLAVLLLYPSAGAAERLLITSDLHLTADAGAQAAALEALADAARDCDVLLLLGDNTNNARADEHARVVHKLGALADLSGAEVYAIPGNHDLNASFHPEDFAKLYGAYGRDGAFARDSASASCAVTTRGGTCLLLIDTNAYGHDGLTEPLGGVSEATLAWVEATLSALDPGTAVIACGHHPILPAGSRQTANADRLAKVLIRGGVKLYLCGHDHGFAAVKGGGLQQITVGQPHAYPGWAGLLTADGEALLWQVRPLYASNDPARLAMASSAHALGERMASGALAGTPYEGDEGAIAWFSTCFDLVMRGALTEADCAALLADPSAGKWREIEPRSVVKRWMFGLLEHCPQDVREIRIPLSALPIKAE